MSYGDDVYRGLGLIVWSLLSVAGTLGRLLVSPIAVIGRVAERLDVPPGDAPCTLRGESHDWEPGDGIDTRRCTDCGAKRIDRM